MKSWFKAVFGWFSKFSGSTGGKLVIQAAAMKYIEAAAGASRVGRAVKVIQLVLDIRSALNVNSGFTVEALQKLIYDKLAEGNANPSDRLLAMALADALVEALGARIPSIGVIPPEARAGIEAVLALVEQAARFYQ